MARLIVGQPAKALITSLAFSARKPTSTSPILSRTRRTVTPDGRHLNDQITDKAIFYIDREKKIDPKKPFFLYYAPGATHAPHQVDKYWSDKYKGKFDSGWDAYRAEVFDRQKKLGVIPANAVLPDRNPDIKAWNSLSPEEKKLYARFMEVYAGYLAYTDFEIGRLVNNLEEIGQFDNTLIFISIGDNGASKEGTQNGVIERSLNKKPITEQEHIASNITKSDEIGTPASTNGNYPLGWAQAANTPFKYWKEDANSEGGTHNPLIVSWPQGIKEKGGIRNQYSHVIDLLPTTLDLLGIKAPEEDPRHQTAAHRGLLVRGFDLTMPNAPWHHTVQYYYIFGSRSIYDDGWKAELAYPNDVLVKNAASNPPLDENAWELYNLKEDPTERIDLAKKNPEKLVQLRAEFEQQAQSHHLYPYITFDDMHEQRIKHTYLPDFLKEQQARYNNSNRSSNSK